MAVAETKLHTKQPYLIFKRQFLADHPDVAREIDHAEEQLREAQNAIRGWDERLAELHQLIERAFVRDSRPRQI